jgi:hypothetical protein
MTSTSRAQSSWRSAGSTLGSWNSSVIVARLPGSLVVVDILDNTAPMAAVSEGSQGSDADGSD